MFAVRRNITPVRHTSGIEDSRCSVSPPPFPRPSPPHHLSSTPSLSGTWQLRNLVCTCRRCRRWRHRVLIAASHARTRRALFTSLAPWFWFVVGGAEFHDKSTDRCEDQGVLARYVPMSSGNNRQGQETLSGYGCWCWVVSVTLPWTCWSEKNRKMTVRLGRTVCLEAVVADGEGALQGARLVGHTGPPTSCGG